MATFAAGSVGHLEAIYQDGTGTAVDPVTPLLTILDPFGVAVVTDAVPTSTGSTGRFFYDFAVPALGPIGSWTAIWSGVINGSGVEGSEVFAVVEAGDIVFPGQNPTGPCQPWATIDDIAGCGPCVVYDMDDDDLEDWLVVASDLLFDLTGQKYRGSCIDVIRPEPVCGCPPMSCRCPHISEYELPGYPAQSVEQVKVNGQIVPQARYQIQNQRWLVYLPDPDHLGQPITGWPRSQRLDYPATAEDTWEITYTWGLNPPRGGVRAAAALACQLALACEGSDECSLPAGVQQIAQQGVTVVMVDPNQLLDEGRTGLATVDAWVNGERLGAQRQPATVWVPGRGRGNRRVTGT